MVNMKKHNLKKIITMVLISMSMLATIPVSASAEWKQDNIGWWYLEGNSWASGWRLINEKWYYFDNNGYMKTGWIQDKNKWYYLYDSGDMAKNTNINGYVLDSDGAWIKATENSSSNFKENNTVNSSEIISNNKNSSDINSNIPRDIEQAVSEAIKSKGKEYLKGEVATEGHIILEVEEKDNVVKAYTISSFSYFGFENGIFTCISGSGAIPTVMTFSKDTNGGYSLIGYKEPEDGECYRDSIKEMFPEKLLEKISKANTSYSELEKSKEAQAKEYLKQIGRNAVVSDKYVEKKLPDINVEAENKLFAYSGKNDSFLNNCPGWLGTREKLENGVRVIYETSQSKSNDGYDLITFKETKEDGTVIEQRSYKIVGNEPELQ